MSVQIKDEISGLIFVSIENEFGLVPRVRWTSKPQWAGKFTQNEAEKMIEKLNVLPFVVQKSQVDSIVDKPKFVIIEA